MKKYKSSADDILERGILIDSKSISSDTEGSCDETKILFL